MERTDVHRWTGIFAQAETRFEDRNRHRLVCKRGYYQDCCVLKLQKRAWTNDPLDQVQNQSGIFFSLWCNESSLRKNRVLYNIHALKLRTLEGYTIASRDFAADFRKRFRPMRADWPNVRVDYGPATLIQGWIPGESDTLLEDILSLMDRFATLSPLIDDLLHSRRK